MPNIEREIDCDICHATFITRGNSGKYCPDCQAEAQRERKRQSQERIKASRPARAAGRYIITGYDSQLVRDFRHEDTVISLKGRLMTSDILRDLIQQLPAGVYIRKNGRKYVTTQDCRLKEITA